MRLSLSPCLIPALSLLTFSPSLFAASLPAFSFNSANFATYDLSTAELGYDFMTGSSAVRVTALGYINDGFDATHTVAIFDVATQQVLPGALVSVTTFGGGPSSTTFSYTSLAAPVWLAANTEYQIVSQFFDSEHYFIQAQGLVSEAGLTIGDAVYDDYGAPPAAPVFAHGISTINYPADFGPNLLVTAVPEPSSLPLLLGGLLILGLAFTVSRIAPGRS